MEVAGCGCQFASILFGIDFSREKRFFLRRVIFYFYSGFLSQTFMIHRAAGEGRGFLFNSCPPLPPATQTLQH